MSSYSNGLRYSLLVLSILVCTLHFSFGNMLIDIDCTNAIEGFYCRGDLKGYRHCSADGTAIDAACPNEYTCTCQLKSLCKVPADKICQKKEKLKFGPNYILTLRGKSYIREYGEEKTFDLSYDVYQRGDLEKRRERIYIGEERQEVIITKRDEKNNLYQYIQDYKNTEQISCEKHNITSQNFVGYEDSFQYFTKQEDNFDIISDHTKYPPHFHYEEWALKIGRTAPNEITIYRYLIFSNHGVRRLKAIVDKRYGDATVGDDMYRMTDLTVTNYIELPIAEDWFRTPKKCDDGDRF